MVELPADLCFVFVGNILMTYFVIEFTRIIESLKGYWQSPNHKYFRPFMLKINSPM